MFDVVLGIKIIHMSDDRNIIGTVHLDTISETVKIDSPLGIRSRNIGSSDEGEVFKLEMYTISEFAGKKSSIIINSSKWVEITEAKEDIMHEYMRIKKSINNQDGLDYRSIDMKKIMDAYEESPKGLKREDIPPHIINSLEGFFAEIFKTKDDSPPKKSDKIRDRWVDNL